MRKGAHFMLRVFFICLLACPCLAWAQEAPTQYCTSGEWADVECISKDRFAEDVCRLMESQATNHGLDPHFFTRLIWQESRFNPNALSPANARGIAQFIPSTAKIRGLEEPYNPAEAIEHSAQYLAELVIKFGSEGMAAVAYNGGEGRAERFLSGQSGLATETINYVEIITGLSAKTWRDARPDKVDMRLSKDQDYNTACLTLAAKRVVTPLRTTPPKPPFSPWGVQVAFGQTKAAAQTSYRAKTRNCPRSTKGARVEYIPVKNRVSGRSGFVMARIGQPSRQRAMTTCAKIASEGCPCRVYQND